MLIFDCESGDLIHTASDGTPIKPLDAFIIRCYYGHRKRCIAYHAAGGGFFGE